MFPNRACKKTIRPEFTTPQNCFLTCGQRLNISRAVMLFSILTIFVTVCRYQLNQKMDMILVRPYLQTSLGSAPQNFPTYLFQNLINPAVKHCLSIFCRKYQVVHQHRYVGTLTGIPAHPPYLRRKRRGIQPKGSILSVSEVIKTRIFTTERQLNLAYRAVTLLADNNFRLTLVR